MNKRVRRRFDAALLPRLFGNNVPSHTTRAPPVGFELATNGIQFYAIANLDKTSRNRERAACGSLAGPGTSGFATNVEYLFSLAFRS